MIEKWLRKGEKGKIFKIPILLLIKYATELEKTKDRQRAASNFWKTTRIQLFTQQNHLTCRPRLIDKGKLKALILFPCLDSCFVPGSLFELVVLPSSWSASANHVRAWVLLLIPSYCRFCCIFHFGLLLRFWYFHQSPEAHVLALKRRYRNCFDNITAAATVNLYEEKVEKEIKTNSKKFLSRIGIIFAASCMKDNARHCRWWYGNVSIKGSAKVNYSYLKQGVDSLSLRRR